MNHFLILFFFVRSMLNFLYVEQLYAESYGKNFPSRVILSLSTLKNIAKKKILILLFLLTIIIVLILALRVTRIIFSSKKIFNDLSVFYFVDLW